jgi:hypothetical protein
MSGIDKSQIDAIEERNPQGIRGRRGVLQGQPRNHAGEFQQFIDSY